MRQTIRAWSLSFAQAEIKDILKGSDVWMDSDEIRRRLERLRRAQMKILNQNKKNTEK